MYIGVLKGAQLAGHEEEEKEEEKSGNSQQKQVSLKNRQPSLELLAKPHCMVFEHIGTICEM